MVDSVHIIRTWHKPTYGEDRRYTTAALMVNGEEVYTTHALDLDSYLRCKAWLLGYAKGVGLDPDQFQRGVEVKEVNRPW